MSTSQQGKGFIQPNALLQAAQTTAGVVLSATGTIRIVDTLPAASSFSGGNNSGSGMGFGSNAPAAAGAGAVRTRGRGANAPTAPGGGAQQQQAVVVEKAAARTRKDLVDVPYSARVWRNVVLQYGDGKVIDPTPLVILGCAVPNVGGVKGVEPYYCPSSVTSAILRNKGGPYTASCDELFAAAVRSFKGGQAVNAAIDAENATTNGGEKNAAAAGESAAAAADRAEEAAIKRAEEAASKAAGHIAYRGGGGGDDYDSYDSEEDDDDAAGGSRDCPRGYIKLPMLRPPVVAPPTPSVAATAAAAASSSSKAAAAGPTMAMVMNHTASGNLKFTYTDYDGVTSGAIVPVIGGTTAAAGGGSSSTGGGLADFAEDDDDEVVNMDGGASSSSGGEKVSAYLNPKAKSNQKYIVKKADLTEKELSIFETLWTEWRKGGVVSKKPSGAAAAPTTLSSSSAPLGSKRGREDDGNGIGALDVRAIMAAALDEDVNASPATSAAANATKNGKAAATAAAAVDDDEAEMLRLRRATENALADLDRDW